MFSRCDLRPKEVYTSSVLIEKRLGKSFLASINKARVALRYAYTVLI